MRITIHSGEKRRVVETTLIGLDRGALLIDDYLDITSLSTDGLMLERDVFTTIDDGAMGVKPEPVVLLTPEELAGIDLIEADGMPLLERAGEDLVPALYDSLFSEEGDFLGDSGRGLRIYYRSGSYESIEAAPLSYADGHIARDDQIDFGNLERGISWDCGVWTVEDDGLMALKPEVFVVATPQLLENAMAVTFSGELACVRDADGLTCLMGADRTDDRGANAADESDGAEPERE